MAISLHISPTAKYYDLFFIRLSCSYRQQRIDADNLFIIWCFLLWNYFFLFVGYLVTFSYLFGKWALLTFFVVFLFILFFYFYFLCCVCFLFLFCFFILCLGVGGWGLWGELISFFLRIICFCLKSWFLISVSLNTKCALWVILMQLKMTFVRPITSVTPDLVFTVTSWWHVSMPRRWEPNNEVLTVSHFSLIIYKAYQTNTC